MSQNICQKCKHAKPAHWLFFGTARRWELATCIRPRDVPVNLVTGKPKTKEVFCEVERMYCTTNDGDCGFQGRWFEARK